MEGKILLNHQKTKRKMYFKMIKDDWQAYVLIAIPILYFIIFKYIPMGGLIIAFKDYNIFEGFLGSKWVGLDVFKEVFATDEIFVVVRNTLMLNLLDLIFSFPAPIILAITLNELQNKHFKRLSQTVLYLPHFISWVIIGGIVTQIFATNTGIINNFLTKFGIEPIPFLTDKNYWLITYVATGIWQSAGWGTIVFLAAIVNINKELYEAAYVDGAGLLRKIWHIVLPGIRSTIIVLLILRIGQMVNIGFERPYVMSNRLVSDYSDVISTYVYRVGMQSGRLSLATAVGLSQGVVGVVLIAIANYISRKFGEEGIW